jgi:hypothetical protein
VNAQSYSREQHEAWLATLTPEQRWDVYIPQGYWPIFIMVALAKRGLLDPKIKPGEQLHMLELMDELVDPPFFTSEMLAMIAPASDTECEIVELAHSLDPPDDKRGSIATKFSQTAACGSFSARSILRSSPRSASDTKVQRGHQPRAAARHKPTPARPTNGPATRPKWPLGRRCPPMARQWKSFTHGDFNDQ